MDSGDATGSPVSKRVESLGFRALGVQGFRVYGLGFGEWSIRNNSIGRPQGTLIPSLLRTRESKSRIPKGLGFGEGLLGVPGFQRAGSWTATDLV